MNKKQKKTLVRILAAAAMMIALHFARRAFGDRAQEPLWFFLYLIPYLTVGWDILLKASPWSCYATSQGKTDYNITVKDCYGAHDEQQHSGNTPYFIPSNAYTYPAYDSCLVEQVVSDPKHGAGAILSNPQTFTWN